MRSVRTLLFALPLLLLAACGGDVAPEAGDPAAATPESESPQPETSPADDASVAGDGGDTSPLMDPEHPDANRTAPDRFRVVFDTSKGEVVVEAHRDWAPRGVDRFYNLVRVGYYDGVRFFRVVDGFVAQFGMHGDPAVNAAWDGYEIPDDPDVGQSNSRGRLTFAHGGPGTRTTQLFISMADNARLDPGFPPFAEVIEGMDVVGQLYDGYGDGPPYGPGPDQGRLGAEGNSYLERDFPRLDFIRTARIVGER